MPSRPARGLTPAQVSRSRDDSYDVVGLEATCMTLARRAGLEVPESRLQAIGARRVFMVKRFDVTAKDGRYHMVSLRTLCKERPGIHVHGYSELAEVLRKHCASAAETWPRCIVTWSSMPLSAMSMITSRILDAGASPWVSPGTGVRFSA